MMNLTASPSTTPEETRPYIGGQALLEGVMMRSPHSFAIVCRKRSGELVVRERAIEDERKGLRAFPFVRGVMTLVESIRLGSEALRISAEVYESDEGQGEGKKASAGVHGAGTMLAALSLPVIALASVPDAPEPAAPTPAAEKARGGVGPLLAIAFALTLFIAAPQGAANVIYRLFLHHEPDIRSVGFQLITGAMKMAIVIGYLSIIRRVPEIRRVFQYHGAEHKTISTYEANEPLIVANARTKTTLHPRCGTTFLVLVALVSVIVFAVIAPLLPSLGARNGIVENVGLFLLKLPFIPVIAATTFELQRLTARYCTHGPLRVLLWPGFAVQKITTIEPDDQQLEVALSSLRATLWREVAPARAPADVTRKVFPSYATLVDDAGYAAAQ